jgi:hypothetical protein
MNTIFIKHLPRDWDYLRLFSYLDGLGIAVKKCFMFAKRGLALAELTEQQEVAQALAIINRQRLEKKLLRAELSRHVIEDRAAGSFDTKPRAVLPKRKQQNRSGSSTRPREAVVHKPFVSDDRWPPRNVEREYAQTL